MRCGGHSSRPPSLRIPPVRNRARRRRRVRYASRRSIGVRRSRASPTDRLLPESALLSRPPASRLTFFLHFQLLHYAHLIYDSFEDAFDGVRSERAGIGLHHVGEHLVFPLGLVNGHLHLAFDLSDLLDDAGPLVEQRYDSGIHYVDARAAIAQPGLSFLFGHALTTWNPCLSSR